MNTPRTTIRSERAPAPVGPYSQAVHSGGMLFVSGQLGMHPATGKLAAGVEEQTRLALKNLEAILQDAGSSPEQVVKTTCFLADMDDFPRFNAIYGEMFSTDPPARSCIAVKTLPKNALVEVEAIAMMNP